MHNVIAINGLVGRDYVRGNVLKFNGTLIRAEEIYYMVKGTIIDSKSVEKGLIDLVMEFCMENQLSPTIVSKSYEEITNYRKKHRIPFPYTTDKQK